MDFRKFLKFGTVTPETLPFCLAQLRFKSVTWRQNHRVENFWVRFSKGFGYLTKLQMPYLEEEAFAWKVKLINFVEEGVGKPTHFARRS